MGNVISDQKSSFDGLGPIVDHFKHGFDVIPLSDGGGFRVVPVVPQGVTRGQPLDASPELACVDRPVPATDALVGSRGSAKQPSAEPDPDACYAACMVCTESMKYPANEPEFTVKGYEKEFILHDWKVRRCAGVCMTERRGKRCRKRAFGNHQLHSCEFHSDQFPDEYNMTSDDDPLPLKFK